MNKKSIAFLFETKTFHTKNIRERERRKCWEDWWRNGWRARSAKKHRKRYDFWRARRPRVFAFLLLSFDTTITRLFKARRKLLWLLSVPAHRVGMDPNASNLFSLFLFFLLNAFDERRSASISSSKRFLLREDIIAALLRPRWVERSGLFLLLQSRKEKERNESSLSSAKGKEESVILGENKKKKKKGLPSSKKERKMRCLFY